MEEFSIESVLSCDFLFFQEDILLVLPLLVVDISNISSLLGFDGDVYLEIYSILLDFPIY
jgi:hypothetical protein